MKDFNSIALIHKSLTGQITEEEKSQLQQWLDQSPAHRNEYQEIKLIWETPIEEELYTNDESRERLEASIDESLQKEKTALRTHKTGLILFVFGIIAISSAVASILFYNIPSEKYALRISKSGRLLILPDSSRVILNDSTTIINTVSPTSRTLAIDGEAFFDIRKDPRPLNVITQQCNVKVKGTSFYISAYKDKATELLVTRGNVEVDYKNKTWSVNEGEYLSLKEGINSTITTQTDPNFMAWQTQRLVFKQTPLEEVFTQLEKYYTIRIDVPQQLNSCRFTGAFESLALKEVFSTLSFSFDLEFKTISTHHYLVSGPGCIP